MNYYAHPHIDPKCCILLITVKALHYVEHDNTLIAENRHDLLKQTDSAKKKMSEEAGLFSNFKKTKIMLIGAREQFAVLWRKHRSY